MQDLKRMRQPKAQGIDTTAWQVKATTLVLTFAEITYKESIAIDETLKSEH